MSRKINQPADRAVREFCDEIVAVANRLNPDADLELSYEYATSEDDFHSTEGVISSNFGIVMVFPDFRNDCAKAAIMNIGLIQALRKEGFEEDEIFLGDKHKIFGELVPFSSEAVQKFAYHLTHRINAVR